LPPLDSLSPPYDHNPSDSPVFSFSVLLPVLHNLFWMTYCIARIRCHRVCGELSFVNMWPSLHATSYKVYCKEYTVKSLRSRLFLKLYNIFIWHCILHNFVCVILNCRHYEYTLQPGF
jgi:hypothetical protein